ncbi:MAG: cell division protein FtsQ/DivIB [Bacteroidetes bacterium]|jgi:cell division protein FtsQ|nr:cell division protein FtsQ/DivIB [Bacteroidota bacterium]
MKKLLKILIFIPVLYLIIIPVYLAGTTNAKPCGGIVIDIKDSSDFHFVTKRQLLNLAYGNSGRILGKPVKEVSVAEIESRINVLRELKEAEVYMTIDGTVHVYADQRDPVMRVMPDNGGDYFIDEDGVVVRRRNLYNPRLHIVGGNVNISSAMLDGVSVLDTSIKNSILKDIYHLVNYINDDNFWSAQIDQIYVDGNDEIDLIPRVGNQLVHMGTAENFEGKLRNLEDFYDKVLPYVGWNKYSLINLEFKDQIVCKKR